MKTKKYQLYKLLKTLSLAFIFMLAYGVIQPVRATPASPLPPNTVIDKIVIEKTDRRLILYSHGQPLRIYQVSLGFGGPHPKQRQGDGRTPEGVFHITNHNPHSQYHMSMRISYPEEAQRDDVGVGPGDLIMIHGTSNDPHWPANAIDPRNWTSGCIALSNRDIDEVARVTPDGTKVEIKP